MISLPHPCLVADIGGTNARFASIAYPGAPLSHMITLASGTYTDFADTIRQAIAKAGFSEIRSLLAAVAGPVQGRTATLTNAVTPGGNLTLDGPKLAQALKLEQGLLLNDFEALSLALPVLAGETLLQLGTVTDTTGGPMLVVGPGTGLGVAALLMDKGAFLPVASEAGHMAFGPETPEDLALWPHLGGGPVSFEDLLSGRGLVRLYAAHASKQRQPEKSISASEVTAGALGNTDRIAVEAVRHFLAILGRFAGDMALSFGATGGVFIGGGITPRLSSLIVQSTFRVAFERKSRASGFLQPIGTHLIMASNATLQGLAAVGAHPEHYRLAYAERFWMT